MKMVYQSDGKIIKEDIIEEWDSVTLGSKYLYDLRDRTIEELSYLRNKVELQKDELKLHYGKYIQKHNGKLMDACDIITDLRKRVQELRKYELFVDHIYGHRLLLKKDKYPENISKGDWVLCKICGMTLNEITQNTGKGKENKK